ncbi:svh-5 [Pristionchus pacificus]|uniref:Tag-97 n=1 Tax=Pristionchus pacificus TaxID=54126 RepID=A0A2A6D3B7_PRIPA|nr:svh-5 [Pristionchus pacificus]|eukprot:PDM84773.1 tag-97 [Pristionchus pacificus]
MLDTSRRMQIPFEDVNMTKFAGLPGMTLMNSSEADWIANDPVYGVTFFREFQALITVTFSARARPRRLLRLPKRIQRRVVKGLRKSARKWLTVLLQLPSTSNNHFLSPTNPPSSLQQQMNTATLEALDQVKMRMGASSLASTLSAALSPSMGLNSLHASLSPQSPLLVQMQQQNKQLSPLTSTEMLMNKYSLGQHLGPGSVLGHNSHAHEYDSDSDDSALHGVNDKIRKNKDGKPRKRSQHSKGNKLWEFIRDALKDPATCPSIVRWEDPHEGVFRIVESERLARLWGERKNNQKMTYEKLSRAMRTYYEKQILVPVPKTGLYPKKLVYKYYYNTKILLPVSGRRLVYKFGPSAYSWNAEGGPAAPSGVLVDEDDDDDEAIDEDEGVVEAPPHPPPPPADHVNHVSVIAYGPAFLSHH